jgi:hypothetical protein
MCPMNFRGVHPPAHEREKLRIRACEWRMRIRACEWRNAYDRMKAIVCASIKITVVANHEDILKMSDDDDDAGFLRANKST